MVFEPKCIDYKLSPITGMTRDSWLEACEYLLKGIFQHIKSDMEPVVMPRKEEEITYPHKSSTGIMRELEEKAEYFEGLARSFFVAAPIIHDKPSSEICGFNLRDYYSKQVIKACTKGDPNYVGGYRELLDLVSEIDPFIAFQQTVETLCFSYMP